MRSYYIYIIRHGLTSGNTQARYIGHTDEPLSPEGIEQIKTMKKSMSTRCLTLFFQVL